MTEDELREARTLAGRRIWTDLELEVIDEMLKQTPVYPDEGTEIGRSTE